MGWFKGAQGRPALENNWMAPHAKLCRNPPSRVTVSLVSAKNFVFSFGFTFCFAIQIIGRWGEVIR
jgi:hypothetical protein